MSLRRIGTHQGSNRFNMPSIVPFLFAMFFAVQNITAQNLSPQTHANRGISLAREGKLLEAEQELREAVRGAPAVAPYRAQLGSILGLQGKWKQSLESFRKAIYLAPENLDFRRETAAVQWQLGLMSSAEKNLQFVLGKRPGDSGATLLLGLVRERVGDYASAARLLGSQFELVISQPDRTVALFHAVVQSGQRDQIPKIIDVLKLRANDKLWKNAIVQCTEIAAIGGDLQSAEVLFAVIPDDDSGRSAAGFQLAKLLYSRDQTSRAKELLLHLTEHDVASAEAEALLGNCFESEHQPGLALQAYERAVEADPSRIDYYEELVSLLLDLRRTNDAIALVNRAFTIAPNDARPWVWKGRISLRANAYQDAMDGYTHAARLDASNADASLGIAAVHFVSGQNEAAIAEYKAGMARFPNDARFYIAYAEVLMSSPDSLKLQAETESLLQKAVKLAPQSAEAHYQLGQLALQRSRLADAEKEFSLSLQTDPEQSKAHFALSAVYRRIGRTNDAAKEFALYQELKQAEESGTTGAATPAGKP